MTLGNIFNPIRLALFFVALFVALPSFGAALPSTLVWELNTSATAANVNGGGFDIASAGLPTDLACTVGNTATPDCTSATVGSWPAAVDGDWLWISGASGTNWNINGKNDSTTTTGGGCFWPISSHSTTHITINAAIGAGVCLYDPNASQVGAVSIPGHWITNTVAGVGTASPTAGTYGIDYSQSTAAALASTGLGSTSGAPTTLTSTAEFNPTMVHNMVHITTTGTGAFCVIGFYEITAYTSASAVTTNVTTNTGTSCVAGTGKVGGALSLGTATDGLAFNSAVAGNMFWMHSGTYSPSANFSITAAGAVGSNIAMVGYNALRSDLGQTVQANRPLISLAASVWTQGAGFWLFQNLSFTGSASQVVNNSGGTDSRFMNAKFVNTSTTAGRTAVAFSAARSTCINCEVVNFRGIGLSIGTSTVVVWGCYAHDSDIGIQVSAAAAFIYGCIIADNVTDAINNITTAQAGTHIVANTLYGAENKKGVAFNILTGSNSIRFFNNIIYGFVSGVVHADAANAQAYDDYNDYFNNTTDVSNWQKGASDLALAPTFASMTQTTGSSASSATNVLTDGAANFNSVSPAIVDNQDCVFISAGTGTGITLTKKLITSHTNTTLTVDSIITTSGSGTSISYQLTTGHNFAIGTNLQALAWPGIFPGGLTTGSLDIGAVQAVAGTGTRQSRVAPGIF